MPAELRDREYMHNVMYKFLTLPTEPEREALLPVSPHISPYLPISPYISPYLLMSSPRSPSSAGARRASPSTSSAGCASAATACAARAPRRGSRRSSASRCAAPFARRTWRRGASSLAAMQAPTTRCVATGQSSCRSSRPKPCPLQRCRYLRARVPAGALDAWCLESCISKRPGVGRRDGLHTSLGAERSWEICGMCMWERPESL